MSKVSKAKARTVFVINTDREPWVIEEQNYYDMVVEYGEERELTTTPHGASSAVHIRHEECDDEDDGGWAVWKWYQSGNRERLGCVYDTEEKAQDFLFEIYEGCLNDPRYDDHPLYFSTRDGAEEFIRETLEDSEA